MVEASIELPVEDTILKFAPGEFGKGQFGDEVECFLTYPLDPVTTKREAHLLFPSIEVCVEGSVSKDTVKFKHPAKGHFTLYRSSSADSTDELLEMVRSSVSLLVLVGAGASGGLVATYQDLRKRINTKRLRMTIQSQRELTSLQTQRIAQDVAKRLLMPLIKTPGEVGSGKRGKRGKLYEKLTALGRLLSTRFITTNADKALVSAGVDEEMIVEFEEFTTELFCTHRSRQGYVMYPCDVCKPDERHFPVRLTFMRPAERYEELRKKAQHWMDMSVNVLVVGMGSAMEEQRILDLFEKADMTTKRVFFLDSVVPVHWRGLPWCKQVKTPTVQVMDKMIERLEK